MIGRPLESRLVRFREIGQYALATNQQELSGRVVRIARNLLPAILGRQFIDAGSTPLSSQGTVWP